MLLGFDATTIRGNKTGVGYYTARLLDRLTRVGGAANPIDELLVLSNRPLRLQPVPRTRHVEGGYFPLRAVWMQGALPLILKSVRPDLCHFTNFLGPRFTDTPYVVTVHDMTLQLLPRHHTWRKRLLTASLSPEIARRARVVITPSESAKEDVARLFGISKNQIRAIPHAADEGFEPTRDEASWSRIEERYQLEKPYVLYVGTLEPRKNLPRTVSAFARLRNRFPEHRLYLAGDLGWQSQALLDQIADPSLDNRVRRLGYVEESDLPALYSHADLFVYLSLYEGFGFPVVEAMACGTPVLTSNTSSLAEIASGAALLVDPENEAEIVESMACALSTERSYWAEAGRRRAQSMSWERTTRATLAVYEEALERFIVRSPPPAEPVNGDDSPARSVVKTIAYGALFDFPMKLSEIHRSLLAVPLSERKIRRLLHGNQTVRESIEAVPPFYFLKGRRHTIEARERASVTTETLLAEHQWVLDLIRKTPFVRMVALSGATAHGNARDGDIDLFLITAKGRTWTVALLLFVAMKLLRLRRTICLNYFVGEDALALPERDAFTASQILALRPLAGRRYFYRLVRANRWGEEIFPNFWRRFREIEPIPENEARAGSVRLEATLSMGPARVLEWLGRHSLKPYLERQLRRRGAGASVKLETNVIKLHFKDHGSRLATHISGMLQDEVPPSPPNGRPRPETTHVSPL